MRSTAREGVTVVSLRGDIDMTAEPEVRQALLVPSEGDAPRTVVDLSQVSFMDSTGFNALINAHAQATAHSGWVRVATPPPMVKRMFQVLGIDEVISSYPTLKDALAG
ncbi:anti-sigma factor antagonist [Streptomyces sp. PRKS01-65]|nr:anti-sigma factor antagonist [Streptomyces harenosi]